MPLGRTREKVFYGLAAARGRPHRYTLVRWTVGVLFTVGVALLPALGVLRFDLWHGRHVYLGEELGFVEVAKRFTFPFLAINVAILIATRFFGRYLCGYVCPYGALSRCAEWLHFRGWRWLGLAATLALSLALAGVTFSFWIDWAVFRSGSSLARSFAAAALLGTTAVIFFSVRSLGLRFCRDYCPSGVYFALLGHESACGVHLARPESCIDCNACDKSCPMDLAPRAMASPPRSVAGGLYPEALTSLSLCIRCGDCVAACEQVTGRSGLPPALVLGRLPSEPRARAPAETVADSKP